MGLDGDHRALGPDRVREEGGEQPDPGVEVEDGLAGAGGEDRVPGLAVLRATGERVNA